MDVQTREQLLVKASLEEWKGYDGEDDWKITDEFINGIVDDLNSNCKYNKNPEIWNEYYIRPNKWTIFDVDYDIENCRRFCYKRFDSYSDYWEGINCETIINEKISPLTQTRSEQIREKIQMKKEIQQLKERLLILETMRNIF